MSPPAVVPAPPPGPTGPTGPRAALETLRETLRSFSRHGGTLLGGALAFFALLSAAPLLVIALDLAARLTSETAARAELLRGFTAWLGPEGASTLAALLDRVHTHAGGAGTRAGGALVLAYGSTRLFTQTQRALNHMWDVTARPVSGLGGRVWKQLRRRALAFAMVVACGLCLLASVLLRAAIESASDAVGARLPEQWHAWDHSISFVVTAFLFAAVFKWLPDVKIAWQDAGAGAVWAAGLFTAGKLLIARYLAHKHGGAAFGVAGSVVMLLLWVHYSAQIFFLGAAYTAVRARRAGRALAPTEDALRVSVEGL